MKMIYFIILSCDVTLQCMVVLCGTDIASDQTSLMDQNEDNVVIT